MHDIEAANRNLGELVAAARDLSLALSGDLDKHVVELGAKDGQVVLGMSSDRLFAPSGDALMMDAGAVLAAVGKVSVAHPSLRVVVREPTNAPLSTARMARLGDGLRQYGVAEARLTLPSARVEQPAPAPVADSAAAPEGAPSAPVAGTDPAENKPPQPSAPTAFAPTTGNYEIAFAP
jgi:hypothetical protein